MPQDAAVSEALRRLDTMEATPTDFEASVLETVMRQGWCSSKQRHILRQMCERYLPADGLAAELAGQARLPGLEDAL